MFKNSNVSISKPKEPSTISSTRSAVFARSSMAHRSSPGHSKKVSRLAFPATTVIGPVMRGGGCEKGEIEGGKEARRGGGGEGWESSQH